MVTVRTLGLNLGPLVLRKVGWSQPAPAARTLHMPWEAKTSHQPPTIILGAPPLCFRGQAVSAWGSAPEGPWAEPLAWAHGLPAALGGGSPRLCPPRSPRPAVPALLQARPLARPQSRRVTQMASCWEEAPVWQVGAQSSKELWSPVGFRPFLPLFVGTSSKVLCLGSFFDKLRTSIPTTQGVLVAGVGVGSQEPTWHRALRGVCDRDPSVFDPIFTINDPFCKLTLGGGQQKHLFLHVTGDRAEP